MSVTSIDAPSPDSCTVQFALAGAVYQYAARCQAMPQPQTMSFSIDAGANYPIVPTPNPINFIIQDAACSTSQVGDPPHELIIVTIDPDGTFGATTPGRAFFRGPNPAGYGGKPPVVAAKGGGKGAAKGGAKAMVAPAVPVVALGKPQLHELAQSRVGDSFPIRLEGRKRPPAGYYIRVGVFYSFQPDIGTAVSGGVLAQGPLSDLGATVYCPTPQPGHYSIYVYAWFATAAKPYPADVVNDLFSHCLRVRAV